MQVSLCQNSMSKIICLGWDPFQHWHYDLQWPKNIRESCLFFWRSASYRVPFPFPTFPSNYLDTRTHQTSFRPSKTSTPKNSRVILAGKLLIVNWRLYNRKPNWRPQFQDIPASTKRRQVHDEAWDWPWEVASPTVKPEGLMLEHVQNGVHLHSPVTHHHLKKNVLETNLKMEGTGRRRFQTWNSDLFFW